MDSWKEFDFFKAVEEELERERIWTIKCEQQLIQSIQLCEQLVKKEHIRFALATEKQNIVKGPREKQK